MTKPVAIAVAGVGRMGRWHLDKALAHPGVRVVGLYDADANRSAEVSATTGVRSFDDYEMLLGEVDAVVVAAATAAHFPLAHAALERGRHVLVEKPIARTATEAETLTALARKGGLRLQVGFLERFRLAQVLERIGGAPVRYVEADRLTVAFPRESGTDVVADLMTHDLDLLYWLTGTECVGVTSIVDAETAWGPVSAAATLRLAGGVEARLSASWVAHAPRRALRIATETHWHEFDFLSNQVASRRRGGEWHTEPFRSVDALALQMDDFVRGIVGESSIGSTASDGLWSLQVAERVRAVAVRPSPPDPEPERVLEAAEGQR